MAALLECGPAVPSGTPEVLWWVVVEWEVEVEVWSPVRASLTLLIIPDMIAVVGIVIKVKLLWV